MNYVNVHYDDRHTILKMAKQRIERERAQRGVAINFPVAGSELERLLLMKFGRNGLATLRAVKQLQERLSNGECDFQAWFSIWFFTIQLLHRIHQRRACDLQISIDPICPLLGGYGTLAHTVDLPGQHLLQGV